MAERRRFGQVIRLKPQHADEYRRLHAAVPPEVLARIERSNIRNYTIWHHDGLLFAAFEYAGGDFEGDMAAMAADPATQAWWDRVKPMQEPLDGRVPGDWWLTMEELFHHD